MLMKATQTAPPARAGLATVREVAAFLGISRAKLYLMMDQGDLPHVKLGKSRRVKWQDVDRLVEASTVGQ